MSSQSRILQRRFGDVRPGLQLIAVEDAAIPVTVVRAFVLAQEKRDLPITEEFVLRFVALGVNTADTIAAYLGLSASHVLDATAAQVSEGHLRVRDSNGDLALTALGQEVVRNLAATQTVLRPLDLTFDRLVWRLADYPELQLITKAEAEERGMTVLPAAKNARIGLSDVGAPDVNALLKGGRLQVLRINKVSVVKHRYFAAQMLIYGDPSRHEIELGLCIDDDLAPDHQAALERVEAVQRLGLSIAEPAPRPRVDADLESQRVDVVPAGDEGSQASSGTAVGTSLVRSVGVYEHAELLADALEGAKRRLLIIAPWVRSAVVTTDFLSKLERRLRAHVKVTIAHGYGDDDSGSDPRALERLTNLAHRYSNFTFVRVRNTHAKILLFDDCWVTTSFNWLSFKGDPERTYRMEEGTLVSIPARVDAAYDRYLELIAAQVVG